MNSRPLARSTSARKMRPSWSPATAGKLAKTITITSNRCNAVRTSPPRLSGHGQTPQYIRRGPPASIRFVISNLRRRPYSRSMSSAVRPRAPRPTFTAVAAESRRGETDRCVRTGRTSHVRAP
jgi:hypothetical protein